MGGYDIFGIWPTWPALGMDQRNQWDMFRDLPRGFDQLKAISEICHQNGAYFFLCYNPWDESTRSDEDHLDGMSNITRVADIDGFVLDTRGASSKELQDAVDAARKGVVMYSEGMAVPRDMQGIVSGRVHNALYYPPLLNLNKFIKPEFAIFRVAEEAREPYEGVQHLLLQRTRNRDQQFSAGEIRLVRRTTALLGATVAGKAGTSNNSCRGIHPLIPHSRQPST